jgi:hypothetical protein
LDFFFPVLAYRLLFGRTNAFSLGFTKSSHWWWSAPIILIFLSGVADILGAFNGWIMDRQIAILGRHAKQCQPTSNDHV